MIRPYPGRAWILLAGLVIVGAATAFRIWASHGVWFFYDDFYFIQRALDTNLTVRYLVHPYNSHLMPGGMLLNWVNAHVSPLNFALPRTEIVVGFALLGLATLRLLLRLFGVRWGVLTPLVLFLFSPILLPATMWWAAGVNQVPMLLATVLALDAFVRYLREPSRRLLVANVCWLLVGLFFVERTLLAVGVLWLVALLYFSAGTLPDRLAEIWRGYRPAVLTHAVLVSAYVAAYVPVALEFNAATLIRRPFFEVVNDLLFTAFTAGFAGGPLTWQSSQVTQSEAHPQPLFLLATQLAVAALVLASARTRRRALRAWLLPLYVLTANVALISVSRAIYFGPDIALDYRFQTEAALAGALAVGMAFMPILGARESSEPRPAPVRLDTAAWAVPCTVLFLVFTIVSTSRFPLRGLSDTSPQRYLDTVADEARTNSRAQLLNAPTPAWMWAPLAYPTNTYAYMFRALETDLRIRDAVTDDAYLVDDRGRFRAVVFTHARGLQETGRSVPDEPEFESTASPRACRRPVPAGRSSWALDGPVFGFGWYVRLSYDSLGSGTLRVVTDGHPAKIRLLPGKHVALIPVTGTFDDVVLQPSSTLTGTCLRNLEVGNVKPAT